MWKNKPQWITVLRRERLAIMMCRQKDLVAIQIRQGNIGSKALLRMHQHVHNSGLQLHSTQHFAESHAFPFVIETAPTGHTVKIAGSSDLREPAEFVPRNTERVYHGAIDPKIPIPGITNRNRAIMQNRTLQNKRLAGL